MKPGGFAIRVMQDAESAAVADFVQRHFGSYQVSDPEFTRHWFQRGDQHTVAVLCRPDESIAGVMMLIRVPARMRGREVQMHWISSILVEEDARKFGAGGRMLHWAHYTLPLVGSMCGNDASLPLTRALGRDVPGLDMRRFVFMHTPRCLDLCDPQQVSSIRSIPFAVGTVNENVQWKWLSTFPMEAEDLWARYLAPFSAVIWRDREYLTWRYERAPHVRYRILDVRLHGRLCGIVVCRFQSTPSGPCNRIVDFAADPEFAADVWVASLRAAAEEGALYSDFIVVGTREDRALKTAGFQLADTVLEGVPNLLAPVVHRCWSYTFHLGGAMARESDEWRKPEAVWFTKGDGDRDWPTPYSIAHGAG